MNNKQIILKINNGHNLKHDYFNITENSHIQNNKNYLSFSKNKNNSSYGNISFKNNQLYINSYNNSNKIFVRICSNYNRENRYILKKKRTFILGNTYFIVSKILPLQLITIDHNKNINTFENIKDNISIGRSSRNNIMLKDSLISKKHALINKKKSEYYIIDNKSTNGSYIHITSKKRGYPLYIGDNLVIDNISMTVNRFNHGIFHDIGYRNTFEDTYKIIQDLNINSEYKPQSYYAVFDGHGGEEVSKYLEKVLHKNIIKEILNTNKSITIDDLKNILKNAFYKTDVELANKRLLSGSTAVVSLVFGDYIITANVGDSRSILSSDKKAIDLSFDQKPNRKDEYERINNNGGFVKHGRVNGQLAVSRAFGDFRLKNLQNLKNSPVISDPEITVHKIKKSDKYLILACDGLWDVYNSNDVVNYIESQMNKHGNIQICTRNLVLSAIHEKGSTDNVSCLIVDLHN